MKIMLAVDGSDFSEAGVQTLAKQVRPEGADVLVVHVIEGPAFFEQDAGVQQRHQKAEKLMAQAVQTLRAAGFQQVTTRVVEGEPRMGLLEVADQWHPDWIVLGSHGRRGLAKFLLGSVAQSVAQHATCSVFIVRTAATQ